MTAIDTNTNTLKKLQSLRDHKVTAVSRYYRVVRLEWWLTKSEAEMLSKEKIKIWTVYEDTGGTSLPLTKAQGKAHGTNAVKQANNIGQPHGPPKAHRKAAEQHDGSDHVSAKAAISSSS